MLENYAMPEIKYAAELFRIIKDIPLSDKRFYHVNIRIAKLFLNENNYIKARLPKQYGVLLNQATQELLTEARLKDVIYYLIRANAQGEDRKVLQKIIDLYIYGNDPRPEIFSYQIKPNQGITEEFFRDIDSKRRTQNTLRALKKNNDQKTLLIFSSNNENSVKWQARKIERRHSYKL